MTRRLSRLSTYASSLKQSDSAHKIFCGHALDGLRMLVLVCYLPLGAVLSIGPLADILIFATLVGIVAGPSVLGGWLVVDALGLDVLTQTGAGVFLVVYVVVFAVGTYPTISTLGDVLAKYDDTPV